MPEVPDTVDDAIEPLSSPSTDEVFEATRPFSAREIASAAASEALSGGGGGSGALGLTKAELTLTRDQIASVGTPYVIVPATEVLNYTTRATEVFMPVAGYAIAHRDSGDGFSNVDDGARVLIVIGSDWSAALMGGVTTFPSNATFFFQGGAVGTYDRIAPFDFEADGEWSTSNPWQDNALAVVVNNNNVGDFVGGDPSITLRVICWYTTIDLG